MQCRLFNFIHISTHIIGWNNYFVIYTCKLYRNYLPHHKSSVKSMNYFCILWSVTSATDHMKTYLAKINKYTEYLIIQISLRTPRSPQYFFEPWIIYGGFIRIVWAWPLITALVSYHLSHNVRKRTFWRVRPAKIQISLRIRAVWSEYLLCAFLIAKDATFLHADNEYSDQSARMRRLIGIFVGRTCQKVLFLTLRLIIVSISHVIYIVVQDVNWHDIENNISHTLQYSQFYVHRFVCTNRCGEWFKSYPDMIERILKWKINIV